MQNDSDRIITDLVKDFFVATLASWPAHGSTMQSAGRAATLRWNATLRWLLEALPPFGHHRLQAPVLSLPYVTMPTVSGLARSLGQMTLVLADFEDPLGWFQSSCF